MSYRLLIYRISFHYDIQQLSSNVSDYDWSSDMSWYSCLTEAAKAAGVKPVDCPLLEKDIMSHSQRPYLASVFYSVPGAKESGGPGNNQLLQAPPTKHAGKRSPKLWPKRHAHVMPLNGPAPPLGDWSEPTEDFCKMHEDFGKEVRRLVAEWRKRGRETVALPEGDLIDLS